MTQRVYDTADHLFSYGYAGLLSGALYRSSLYDAVIGSQQYASDDFLFEVLSDAGCSIFKFNEFAVHYALQAVDIGNTVTYADDSSGLFHLHFTVIIFYFIF